MPDVPGNQIKMLPTYDVSNYGTDIFLPLGNQASLTATSITLSTTTITQSLDGTAIGFDKQDTLLSDADTVQLLHEGNDTAFDETYRWRPDMSAIVYHTRILLAIGLNVSVFTSGSIDLTEATITITETSGANKMLFQQTFPLTIAALTGTGSAYFILDAVFDEIFKVFSGNPIDVRIEIPAATETGVSTTQAGIVPLFSYQSAAVLKPFTLSGISLHVHPSLDHADPIWNFDIERTV